MLEAAASTNAFNAPDVNEDEALLVDDEPVGELRLGI